MNAPRAEPPSLRVPTVTGRGGDPEWDGHRQPVPLLILPRAGVSAGIFCAPVTAWLVMPLFGAVVIGTEVAVVLAVVLTALFGSDTKSDRAFRLLRWSLNRPEPPAGTSRRITKETTAPGPCGQRGRT